MTIETKMRLATLTRERKACGHFLESYSSVEGKHVKKCKKAVEMMRIDLQTHDWILPQYIQTYTNGSPVFNFKGLREHLQMTKKRIEAIDAIDTIPEEWITELGELRKKVKALSDRVSAVAVDTHTTCFYQEFEKCFGFKA